jgi:hypothetical protein
VPAWALRLLAVFVTGLSMIGSTTYTLAHPKNANAPLQPPVAEKPQVTEPEPEPTPAATLPFRTLAPTVPPTPTVAPTTTAPTATPRASATVASSAAGTARASTAPTTTPRPATPAPTLRPTPVPQITLAAGVRATALPKVTYTHSS